MHLCMPVKEMWPWPQWLSVPGGHRAGRTDEKRVSVLRHRSPGQNKGILSVSWEKENKRRWDSLPQPGHPVSPLMSAFIKTKSSLASTGPSVISFSNKTKGNYPHFLLELVVPDLCALKLRGGRARLQTRRPSSGLVWLPGRPPLPASVLLSPSPSLWGRSVQLAEAGALAQVASFTQTHSKRFWVSRCPGGAEKAPVVETGGPASFRCMSVKLDLGVCPCQTGPVISVVCTTVTTGDTEYWATVETLIWDWPLTSRSRLLPHWLMGFVVL